MRQSPILLLIFVIFMSGGALHAATNYVDASRPDDSGDGQSWATAKKTIQAAVNITAAGSTVLAATGTYTLASEIFIGTAITLRGAEGYTNTIVDGGGVTRCFNITANATLDGLTISNGVTSGTGGGIYMQNGLVTNCLLCANRANGGNPGGGIFMTGGTVAECQFLNNAATAGGDWGGGGIGIAASGPAGANVNHCQFVGNSSPGSGGGVTIQSWNGLQTVRDCVFSNNVDAQGVSAGYIVYAGVFLNCLAVGNRSGGFGLRDGGTAIGCTMRNNTGAGAYFRGGTFRNCLIYSNTSDGVRCSWGGSVENCTIVSNGGVGVMLYGGSPATLINNIVYANVSGLCGGSDIANTYWYNNCTPSSIPGGAVITNNIVADPKFMSIAAGDFHVRWSSPCLNAGTNQPWMATAVDLDGRPRILRGIVDIGAYELPPDPGMRLILR